MTIPKTPTPDGEILCASAEVIEAFVKAKESLDILKELVSRLETRLEELGEALNQ